MHVLVDVLMKVLQKYVNLYNETIKTNKNKCKEKSYKSFLSFV